MKNKNFIKVIVSIFIMLSSSLAFAWGKRGHETVGSLAARLLAEKSKEAEFLMHHSYDMGFYNNVPDIVWKSNPETYKKEYFQHFMDMEQYHQVKTKDWNNQREVFFKKNPSITSSAGRSWWRIQELNNSLENITKLLRKKNSNKQEHQTQQGQWLLHAGVMGHYIADLAQPLHVTDNYDGKKTDQKGIHKWFEETIVDYLYPQLQNEVYKKALTQWDDFHKANKSKNVFKLSQQLTEDSQKLIEPLLAIDKKSGRKNISSVSSEYQQMIIDRLALGTLYLAEIWSRQTGWKYDEEKFFLFHTAPQYIEPKPN